LSGTTWMSQYQKKHSLTHTYRGHQSSLSAFSIYYDPWHPPCSVYKPDSHFPQSLSKFSLVYLLAWHPPLHTLYISSPNHWLLFAAQVHTITACFAVILRLCHLILVSAQPFTWNSILQCNATHPSDHSHLFPLKCHLILLSYGPCLTSVQHTTLHTTAVQSPSHYQWYVLIGKHWYQLLVFTTTTTTTTILCSPLRTFSGTTRVSRYQKGKMRKIKPVWIYCSKRYWVAVASTAPCANLHFTADR